ncbi:MAG: IS1 family transposase [Aquisalinus sp.]|nr:IS1 family transposase [Aquisalinus sp.]
MTSTHRDTIMRLALNVGNQCKLLHDQTFHDLNVDYIELDELWSFVGKKQRKTTKRDGDDMGDQYIFTALDRFNKAILSYRIGKRNATNTRLFMYDLRDRVLNTPQISSDSFPAYPEAVWSAFGDDCHYGQVVKSYKGEPHKDSARRYSPGVVTGIRKERIRGIPVNHMISTSLVERSNLSARMASRRLTRLTNGFSKKLENHKAAFALYVAHYNFCRVHETIKMTPAMALGLSARPLSIGDLIEAAHSAKPSKPEGNQFVAPRAIEGGLS